MPGKSRFYIGKMAETLWIGLNYGVCIKFVDGSFNLANTYYGHISIPTKDYTVLAIVFTRMKVMYER